MALPILETQKFEATVPSTGKKVLYRPYLVKEEKILMMALESKDNKQVMQAIVDVIESCTFGKLKGTDLATFDLEYLFLKLRAKSVGEHSDFGLSCKECNTTNEVSVNLDEIEVEGVDKKAKIVKLTDNIGLTLKYPSMAVLKSMDLENVNADMMMKLIVSCIDSIYDAEKIYPASESTEKELVAFIESLSTKQFESIKGFIEKMPKLRKTVTFSCQKCGTENNVTLEGLQSFFK